MIYFDGHTYIVNVEKIIQKKMYELQDTGLPLPMDGQEWK